MKKTLMIIGAGLMQIPAIKIASEMGLKTVVTDYDPHAEGLKYADVPLIISTRDFEGTVRMAREYHKKNEIDGVITVGTDASMTAAAVANALNLPGIKFEDAEAATNKIKMRKRFAKFNVPSPAFAECWTLDEAKKAIKKLGFPLVIKPSDNMGARGVMKINTIEDLEYAFNNAKKSSPSGELIIEEYMEGDELSIDALVYNDNIFVTGIADRIIDLEPYFIELGHIIPSSKNKKILNQSVDVLKQGIKALGITLGAAKADIKLTKSGPKIGELAARLSGGFMSAYTYPYSTGVNVIRAAIRIALGEAPGNLKPKYHKVAMEKAIIPGSGYILDIKNVDKAKKIHGVKQIFLFKHPGEIAESPKSNVEKTGNIIAVANTKSEVKKIIQQALNTVKVELGPIPILNYDDLRKRARQNFNGTCAACPVCNGEQCISGVPGMGGIGNANVFKENWKYLQNKKIRFNYIHSVKKPQIKTTFLNYALSSPIIAAPMSGVAVNMGGSISEYEYHKAVLHGCRLAGTIGCIAGGADPEIYKEGLKALKEENGWGIGIFKPRLNQKEIIKRLKALEKLEGVASGMDIDAAAFLTFTMENQKLEPKSETQLKELIQSTKKPFIIKGILSQSDADKAFKAGAKAIVVSNHGGRVSDSTIVPYEVLNKIAQTYKNKMTILVDGGIRSGEDIFKALALGADAVLIGRPIAIAAISAGAEGVKFYIERLMKELRDTMLLVGVNKISNISKQYIL